MNNSLGKNIANQRHRARLTQEQLAELSDMTVNYLSKVERGVVKQVGSVNLYRIAQALEVPMEDLVVGRPVDRKPQPARRLLNQQLDLLTPAMREQYCRLFVNLLRLAAKEK